MAMPMRSITVSSTQQDVTEQTRELVREQVQLARDQAQVARDRAMMARDAARAQQGFTIGTPPGHLSRRQEGMLFTAFLVSVMAAVVILRPIFRAFGRRLEGAPHRGELASTGSAERLERIEQAVEAMAVEVERISEGQRFTTRLLTSRAAAELPIER
jgi:hypothetical protein